MRVLKGMGMAAVLGSNGRIGGRRTPDPHRGYLRRFPECSARPWTTPLGWSPRPPAWKGSACCGADRPGPGKDPDPVPGACIPLRAGPCTAMKSITAGQSRSPTPCAWPCATMRVSRWDTCGPTTGCWHLPARAVRRGRFPALVHRPVAHGQGAFASGRDPDHLRPGGRPGPSGLGRARSHMHGPGLQGAGPVRLLCSGQSVLQNGRLNPEDNRFGGAVSALRLCFAVAGAGHGTGVLPFGFGFVHGLVRALQELVFRVFVIRENRYADAASDLPPCLLSGRRDGTVSRTIFSPTRAASSRCEPPLRMTANSSPRAGLRCRCS